MTLEVAGSAGAGGALGAGWCHKHLLNRFYGPLWPQPKVQRDLLAAPFHFAETPYLPERVGKRLSFGGCAPTAVRVGSGPAIVRWITPVCARGS